MNQATAKNPAEQAAEPKTPGIYQEMKMAILANIDSTSGKPDAWQAYNATNGRSFDGAARLRLATAGFEDPRWLTEAQAKAIGATIKPEAQEHGVNVYFKEKGSYVPTIYTLYNAEQVEGLAPYQSLIPENAKAALFDTAAKNQVIAGKACKIEALADSIIQSTIAESTGTTDELVKKCIAAECSLATLLFGRSLRPKCHVHC